MRANYHTHTRRCNHATGAEWEYLDRAREGHLSILGFSDHTPYFYDDPDYVSPVRMFPEQLSDYVEVLEGLRRQYAGEVELHIGLEAEYYPRQFPRLLEMLRSEGVEYLILGQHFLGGETGEPYCGERTVDPQLLDRYISQSIEGLQTGCFTYFAHPDLICFMGDEKEYERQMRRLCRAALALDVPLEFNLLGFRTGRSYPDRRFWRIAAEEGNSVILGSDAHRPADVWVPEAEQKALDLLHGLGLPVLETVELRPLK